MQPLKHTSILDTDRDTHNRSHTRQDKTASSRRQQQGQLDSHSMSLYLCLGPQTPPLFSLSHTSDTHQVRTYKHIRHVGIHTHTPTKHAHAHLRAKKNGLRANWGGEEIPQMGGGKEIPHMGGVN